MSPSLRQGIPGAEPGSRTRGTTGGGRLRRGTRNPGTAKATNRRLLSRGRGGLLGVEGPSTPRSNSSRAPRPGPAAGRSLRPELSPRGPTPLEDLGADS